MCIYILHRMYYDEDAVFIAVLVVLVNAQARNIVLSIIGV